MKPRPKGNRIVRLSGVVIRYDYDVDQIIFITPGGTRIISATNDDHTWRALGEGLVRDVKAYGKEE